MKEAKFTDELPFPCPGLVVAFECYNAISLHIFMKMLKIIFLTLIRYVKIHEHNKILITGFVCALISLITFIVIMLVPGFFRGHHELGLDHVFMGLIGFSSGGHISRKDDATMGLLYAFWGLIVALIHIFVLYAIVSCCWGSICDSKDFILGGQTSRGKQVKELSRRVVPLFIALALFSTWGSFARNLIWPGLCYLLTGAGFLAVRHNMWLALVHPEEPKEIRGVREVKYRKKKDRL